MKTILDEIKQYEGMDEKLLKEGTPSQMLLRYKMTISSILQKRDKEKYYCVESFHKFGMSEDMVNQLMKFAFERGFAAGKQTGSYEGYDKAKYEIREKLESILDL
jgi:hypothetical protein